MNDLKITLVGGGSPNWTPRLVGSLLGRPELDGSTITLFDLNPEPLALAHALCQRYLEMSGSKCVVEQTTDRAAALDGAHAVSVTITTGGLRAMRQDMEGAERYGIFHTVGDTCGPAGISRLLRNVPVFLELGRAMETHCPDAWMLNCSNPLSGLTRVVNRETSIRALGVCHGVPNVGGRYAKALKAERFAYVNTGIDHLSWFTSFVIDGKEMRDTLKEMDVDRWFALSPEKAKEDPTFGLLFPERNGIRLGLQLGALPAIGDRHLCEFLPTFLSSEENVARFGLTRTTMDDREAAARGRFDDIERMIADPNLEVPHPEMDDVGAWITALHGGEPIEDNVSAPNVGQIPQLPDGCVVETRAVLDTAGCHPLSSPLPEALEAIVRPHAIRDEMAVEAALTGDFDLALAALSSDPLVGGEDTARDLMMELVEATKEWLPRF